MTRNSRKEQVWRNSNGTRESRVFICQLDSWRPVVSSTSTTWRHGSNEAEASLHADARRLCETVEEKAAWAGRTNPSRSGFETTRHGPCGMLIKWNQFYIYFFSRLSCTIKFIALVTFYKLQVTRITNASIFSYITAVRLVIKITSY